MLENLLQIAPIARDAFDDQGAPMFEAAQKRYGPLPPLHIYGMRPAAPFDTPFALDHHAVIDVTLRLDEKIGESIFKLDDPEGGRFALRQIGPLQTGEAPWPDRVP